MAVVVAVVIAMVVMRFIAWPQFPFSVVCVILNWRCHMAGLFAYLKQQTSTASANFLRSGCFGQSISFQQQKKEGGHCLPQSNEVQSGRTGHTDGQTERQMGRDTHTHTHSRMGGEGFIFQIKHHTFQKTNLPSDYTDHGGFFLWADGHGSQLDFTVPVLHCPRTPLALGHLQITMPPTGFCLRLLPSWSLCHHHCHLQAALLGSADKCSSQWRMPRDRWQLPGLKQRAAASPFYKEMLST